MNLILGKKYLLDTNILIYSLDKTSPFYQQAKEIIRLTFEQRIQGFVAQQNLIELVNVLIGFYGISSKNALLDAKMFAYNSNLILIYPLATTFITFADFLDQTKKLKGDIFDIYLAATAWDNNITNILTVNTKDFYSLPKIAAINPFK